MMRFMFWFGGMAVFCSQLVMPVLAATPPAPAGTGPKASDRFVVSDDGQEVTDPQSRVIWRRCVEGMKWSGKICFGNPMKLNFVQAQAHAQAEAKATQLAWRLPRTPELVRLVDKSRQNPTTDPVAFPNTPPTWLWSASITVGTAAINQYNYGNIAQGRAGGSASEVSVLQGWGVDFKTGQAAGSLPKKDPALVRLVRSMP